MSFSPIWLQLLMNVTLCDRKTKTLSEVNLHRLHIIIAQTDENSSSQLYASSNQSLLQTHKFGNI